MAVGAARPAIRHREPAGRRQQYRAPRRSCSAPPDGYTLLLVSPANAINATLYDKLNFNFIRDIAPVASIIRVPHVMVVNPSFPAKTVPEFIAYAKANPGKINMASAGIGSAPHVSGELFKMMTGSTWSMCRIAAGRRADRPARRTGAGPFVAPASSLEYVKAGSFAPWRSRPRRARKRCPKSRP